MAYNRDVEKFCEEEYPMMRGKTYLDHAGTTIYSRSLIDLFSRSMIENLYGNLHSASSPAKLSGEVVDTVREKTLRFFNADPEDFDLVFTANATASIKLVAESFRDLASSSSTSGTFWYGYHKDSHTSLVGVRELSTGSHHCFGSDKEVEDWLNGSPTGDESDLHNRPGLPGLFAFPGQSNMTGRRLPLIWSQRLRMSSLSSHQNTYSLLDAAALATTTQLDFSDPDFAPDFTAVSFYKIFGFPDLGGLIVRKRSGHILQWRKYFGGGTINSLTVFHVPTVQRKDLSIHDGLEDGTLPFHSIMALGCAIDVHQKFFGSMKIVSQHVSFLSHRLCTGMKSLRHFNGTAVCVIYNDDLDGYGNATVQGGTIAFNIMQANGMPLGHTTVEKTANEHSIFVRSGGLCNAGGNASYLQLEPWHMKRNWSAGLRCGEDHDLDVLNGKPTGVVRASLGAMSTIGDVDTFLAFLAREFGEPHPVITRPQGVIIHRRPRHPMSNDSGYAEFTDNSNPFRDPSVHYASIPKLKEQNTMSADWKNNRHGPRPSLDILEGPLLRCAMNNLPDDTYAGNEMDVITQVAAVEAKATIKPRLVSKKSMRSLRFWKSKKQGIGRSVGSGSRGRNI